MVDLVVIEDSTVLTMIRDPQIANAIPCLMNKIEVFKQQAGGCGACARKRQQKQRDEMAKIKACLANMGADKKAELKKLLDAKKVRVVFSKPDGSIVQLTF